MREGVFRHPGNVRIKEVEKTLCGSLVKNNLWNEVSAPPLYPLYGSGRLCNWIYNTQDIVCEIITMPLMVWRRVSYVLIVQRPVPFFFPFIWSTFGGGTAF